VISPANRPVVWTRLAEGPTWVDCVEKLGRLTLPARYRRNMTRYRNNPIVSRGYLQQSCPFVMFVARNPSFSTVSVESGQSRAGHRMDGAGNPPLPGEGQRFPPLGWRHAPALSRGRGEGEGVRRRFGREVRCGRSAGRACSRQGQALGARSRGHDRRTGRVPSVEFAPL
jgi:hypothetical protein